MTDQLNRSNTTTTFASFFCSPNRKPSQSRLTHRPLPPPNYQHIEDNNAADDDDDDDEPPLAFRKLSYPRSRSIDLRASKLGLVEKMSAKERIERWNDVAHPSDENESDEPMLTPLEKWRLVVAREVGKEKRKEEIERQREMIELCRREAEEEEIGDEEGRGQGGADARVVSWKPSVLTSSSMRSATRELRKQFESSSPFARSFGIENLKTPLTAESAPSSSVVRESFLEDPRQPQADHPYSHTFGFDETTGALVAAAPRPTLALDPSSRETLIVPGPPETAASVSPIDPVFASDTFRFRFSQQRHPLPRIDTAQTPVSAGFSNSPVSAPVVTTYQAFHPPPRSSSLPFNDLQSVQLSSPSPPATSVPPAVPPEDDPQALEQTLAILPPKAAALLGLVPTSLATPRPPRPHFVRDRSDSFSSSGSPSISTGQYRSSFYTNYDGPSRPSVDSSTPTTLTSPSTFHRIRASTSSTSPVVIGKGRIGNAAPTPRSRSRPPPPPLTFQRREGMSSLPDLHDESPSASASSRAHRSASSPGSSVSSSLDLSLRGHSSLDTPRTLVLPSHDYYQHQARNLTLGGGGGGGGGGEAETEVESLLDAPLHGHQEPLPSPPFPLSSSNRTRFGNSIGQDLPSSIGQQRRQRRQEGGGGGIETRGGTLRTKSSRTELVRSISQKGKGLARKLSLKNMTGSFAPSSTSQSQSKPTTTTTTTTTRTVEDLGQTTKKDKTLTPRKSLRTFKRNLDQKVEGSFRYW